MDVNTKGEKSEVREQEILRVLREKEEITHIEFNDVIVSGSIRTAPKIDFADSVIPAQRDASARPRSSSPRRQSPELSGEPSSTSPTIEKTTDTNFYRFPNDPTRISPQKNGASTAFDTDNPEEMVPDGTNYVLTESPHSKARAIRALQKEQSAREQAELPTSRPSDRVKTLPTPPVAPVLPDFDDIIPRRSSPGVNDDGSGVGIRRKSSVVKKLRDRIAK